MVLLGRILEVESLMMKSQTIDTVDFVCLEPESFGSARLVLESESFGSARLDLQTAMVVYNKKVPDSKL